MSREGGARTIDGEVIAFVKGLEPSVGLMVLKQYRENMPFNVKKAIDEIYALVDGDENGEAMIGKSKEALKRLKAACEANPDYAEVYDLAKREVQEAVADAVANEGFDMGD